MGWLRMISILAKNYIGHVASDLSILRDLGVQGRPRRTLLFILVYWLPPQID